MEVSDKGVDGNYRAKRLVCDAAPNAPCRYSARLGYSANEPRTHLSPPSSLPNHRGPEEGKVEIQSRRVRPAALFKFGQQMSLRDSLPSALEQRSLGKSTGGRERDLKDT